MKIYHEESNVYYEIAEQKGVFKLIDSKTNKVYAYKESYEAVWHVIELIRISCFEVLSENDLSLILKTFSLPLPKTLLGSLKREKFNRTYYDQVFMKLLSQFRGGADVIYLNNTSNFSIQHELVHLVRKAMGAKSGSALQV